MKEKLNIGDLVLVQKKGVVVEESNNQTGIFFSENQRVHYYPNGDLNQMIKDGKVRITSEIEEWQTGDKVVIGFDDVVVKDMRKKDSMFSGIIPFFEESFHNIMTDFIDDEDSLEESLRVNIPGIVAEVTKSEDGFYQLKIFFPSINKWGYFYPDIPHDKWSTIERKT